MKQFDSRKAAVFAFMLCTLAMSDTHADDPGIEQNANDKGFAIAAQSDHSDLGFSDSKVHLKMILRNAEGSETTVSRFRDLCRRR